MEYKNKRVEFNHEKYGKGKGTVISIVNEELLMIKLEGVLNGATLYLYPNQVQVID